MIRSSLVFSRFLRHYQYQLLTNHNPVGHSKFFLLDNPYGVYVRYNSRFHYGTSSKPETQERTSLEDDKEPESKVELTIRALKEEKKKMQDDASKPLTSKIALPVTLPSEGFDLTDKGVSIIKPLRTRIWEKVKHECLHYYHGFRLLGLEIKISSGLLWQVLNGHTLTRRERKQFLRTVSDLFRLIPFLVFIIVPFMEFLLPVALKLFPNMLPSTFNTDPSAEKLQKQLKARLEVAKFLQETIRETALQHKDQSSKSSSDRVASFLDFMEKVRKGDQSASNEDIIKFSRLFEDEFTLDTLNRDQLVAMCKLLQLKPIGNNYFLRFQLNTALKSLKQDDLLIRKEGGVDTLSVAELQSACRARGMRALGLSEERLKSQLANWLALHLDNDVPASLLLLSRTLVLASRIPTPDEKPKAKPIITPIPMEEREKVEDARTEILKQTIATLPKAAEEQAKLRAAEIEGAPIDPKILADILKKEAQAIKQEKAEKAKDKKTLELESKQKLAAEKELLTDKAPVLEDKAKLLDEKTPTIHDIITTIPTPKQPTIKSFVTEKSTDEKELLKEEISHTELKDIVQAVESLADSKEMGKDIKEARETVKDIKEDLMEYKEDIQEAKELVEQIKGPEVKIEESKSAIRLAQSVDKILGKADKIVEQLEKSEKKLDTVITDKEHLLTTTHMETPEPKPKDLEKGQMVTVSELVDAIRKTAKIEKDDERLKKLANVFDEDKDGKVNLEHVLEAIELISRENVNLDIKQIRNIVTMMKKEDVLEEKSEK